MTASGVEALADAVSAALGSMASALTLYPLDLVKTRLQAQLVGEHHDCRGGRSGRAQQGAAKKSSEHNPGDWAPRGGVHAGDLSGNTHLSRARCWHQFQVPVVGAAKLRLASCWNSRAQARSRARIMMDWCTGSCACCVRVVSCCSGLTNGLESGSRE